MRDDVVRRYDRHEGDLVRMTALASTHSFNVWRLAPPLIVKHRGTTIPPCAHGSSSTASRPSGIARTQPYTGPKSTPII
jgi:hypothetical protein